MAVITNTPHPPLTYLIWSAVTKLQEYPTFKVQVHVHLILTWLRLCLALLLIFQGDFLSLANPLLFVDTQDCKA